MPPLARVTVKTTETYTKAPNYFIGIHNRSHVISSQLSGTTVTNSYGVLDYDVQGVCDYYILENLTCILKLLVLPAVLSGRAAPCGAE
jgi:dUTPase